MCDGKSRKPWASLWFLALALHLKRNFQWLQDHYFHKSTVLLSIYRSLSPADMYILPPHWTANQDNWNWHIYFSPPMFPVLGNEITIHLVTVSPSSFILSIHSVHLSLETSLQYLLSLHRASVVLDPASSFFFSWTTSRPKLLAFNLFQFHTITFKLNIIVHLLSARCRVPDAGCTYKAYKNRK